MSEGSEGSLERGFGCEQLCSRVWPYKEKMTGEEGLPRSAVRDGRPSSFVVLEKPKVRD